uniref:restriction endonuclease subunit S n=1 Tax=Vibrio parahaemolyticus TaxID=670 RepID=UPI002151E55D|nr:restriction endonuclease subunit S [Vibrio parahaemolyticus]
MEWGGLRQSMKFEDFRRLPIVLPSYEEQQKIANFLDHETAKIDTLIAKQEKLIELLKEKRQAVISHAVTKGLNPDVPMKDSGVEWLGDVPEHWVVTSIKRELKSLDSRRIPLSADERGKRTGEYRYYGASGVIDFIDDYIFDEPTVLVGEDGANLLNRNTPLAFSAHGQYWVNNHAHILSPLDGLVDYWAEVIEIIDVTPIVSGSAQPKLTAEALNNLKISFPASLEERQTIEKFICIQQSKYDQLMRKAKNQVELLKERKTALISAAVTGKIDVRDWQEPTYQESA